jgi:dihydroanticapsin dehydrogenase
MRGLTDKIAVVTGGCNGIGEAIVNRLVEEGCRVAAWDREEPGQELAAKWGDRVSFTQLDITEDDTIGKAAADLRENLGPAHILVNNAAVFVLKGVDASVEEIERSCRVNIQGTSRVTHYVVGQLRENGGGSIINLSSTSGFIADAGCATYNMTKFAIRGLTKCWAADLSKENIRVNTVCPSWVATQAYFNYLEDFGSSRQQEEERINDLHLLGRVAKAGEVAGAVAFLASEDATFITGSDLLVDGGLLAR